MSSRVLVASPSPQESVASEQAEPTAVGSGEGSFSQKILNVGFAAALVLAAMCLAMGAFYLYTFLRSTNAGIDQVLGNMVSRVPGDVLYMSINGRLVMARVALMSCGIFVGMSFGFLGFALFLVGAKGEINAAGSFESYSVKIARMSPGVFVLLCATVLIGVCVSRSTPFSYQATTAFSEFEKPSKATSSQDQVDLDDSKPKSTGHVVGRSTTARNTTRPRPRSDEDIRSGTDTPHFASKASQPTTTPNGRIRSFQTNSNLILEPEHLRTIAGRSQEAATDSDLSFPLPKPTTASPIRLNSPFKFEFGKRTAVAPTPTP